MGTVETGQRGNDFRLLCEQGGLRPADDRCREAPGRADLLLGAQVADGADGLLHQGEVCHFAGFPTFFGARLRPGSDDQCFGPVRCQVGQNTILSYSLTKMAPQLFRYEWGKGMEQPQTQVQNPYQDGSRLRSGFILLHLQLRHFHIPVGEIGPEELVDLPPGLTVLVCLEQALHFAHQLFHASPDPGIGQRPAITSLPPLSRFRERGMGGEGGNG